MKWQQPSKSHEDLTATTEQHIRHEGDTGGYGVGCTEGKVWRSTYKAVQTQDGAHTRRFVATARVLLSKGDAGANPPRRASNEESRLSSTAS